MVLRYLGERVAYVCDADQIGDCFTKEPINLYRMVSNAAVCSNILYVIRHCIDSLPKEFLYSTVK